MCRIRVQPIGLVLSLIFFACQCSTRLSAQIVNHSFETPALDDGDAFDADHFFGWSAIGGGGNTGIYNPHDSDFISGSLHGENLAYANPGVFGGGGIQQTTNTPLEPGTYELIATVGRRVNHTVVGYSNELWVGNTSLTPSFVDHPMPTEGALVEATTRYDIGAGHPLLGQPIQIRLFTSVGGNQTNWDNIRIVQVPEPASFSAALPAAVLGPLALARRRN